jgi:hypothetical protein
MTVMGKARIKIPESAVSMDKSFPATVIGT